MSRKKDNNDSAQMVEVLPTLSQTYDGCECQKHHEYQAPCHSCGHCSNNCSCSNNRSYTKGSKRMSCGCNECISASCTCGKYGMMPLPVSAPRDEDNSNCLYVTLENDFIYPEPGFYSSPVTLDGPCVADGQPLYNPEYGCFHVKIKKDVDGSEVIVLENQDASGNAASPVGRPVPCGTEFFPGCPGGITGEANSVCNELVADFFIPAVGEESTAIVSSFSNFIIGEEAVIRSKSNPGVAYTYKVVGFNGTDAVILENTGDGGDPTGIKYLSADSGCDGADWCIEAYGERSLCQKSSNTECIKFLHGFDEDCNDVKISGGTQNEVLAYDETCDGFVKKVVERTKVCRDLTCCIQIPKTEEFCDVDCYFISTSDDELILNELQSALLSENASPIIEVCGKSFSVLMDQSEPDAIKVRPNFVNPDEIIKLEPGCAVCIPSDCCSQCNPQVLFPIPELSPNPEGGFGSGLNAGYLMNVPPEALALNADPHSFLTVAYYPGQTPEYVTHVHDPVTKAIIGSYAPDGTEIPLPEGASTLDSSYYQFDYCNETACPVNAVIEESIAVRPPDLPNGCCMTRNEYAYIKFTDCFSGSDQIIRTTQYNMPMYWEGPLKASPYANEPEQGWITGSPGLQPYDTKAQKESRNFALGVGECLNVRIQATYQIFCEEPIEVPLVFYHSSTLTFFTEIF